MYSDVDSPTPTILNLWPVLFHFYPQLFLLCNFEGNCRYCPSSLIPVLPVFIEKETLIYLLSWSGLLGRTVNVWCVVFA